jgi:Fe-S-cluster containining protein
MEITIDFALVRSILKQEHVQARADIAEAGIVQAYERSQRRHDARLAAAPDAPSLACKAGCSWCCHFTVDVRPVEVFRILDFVEGNFTAQEQARVRSEIEANSAVLRPLDEVERMQRNVKCPFLQADAPMNVPDNIGISSVPGGQPMNVPDIIGTSSIPGGRCTIYAARPQTCRNYHATNAAGCQKSFEEPDNLDIDPDFAPLVYQTGGAHVDGFSKALLEAGYDVSAHELNTALAAAMVEPVAARQRFEAGAQAFPSLQGADVPLEFAEE